jgi:hypothetical protein
MADECRHGNGHGHAHGTAEGASAAVAADVGPEAELRSAVSNLRLVQVRAGM